MKKIACFCIILSNILTFSNTIEIRNGGDFNAKYHRKNENIKPKFPLTDIAIEYRKEITENFEFGGGAAFQYHKRIKGDQADGFNSFPIYIAARLNIYEIKNIQIYGKSEFGYSFHSGDFDNGVYYGGGIGIQYKRSTWDIMYKMNKAKIKNGAGEKEKFDYDRISLSGGYLFNF